MNHTKPRKQYTPEFKAQAIELLAIDRPVAELAKELCISANLLYSDDPRALRRENGVLREENEILKKPRSSLALKPAQLRTMTDHIHQETGHWSSAQHYHASEPTKRGRSLD